MAIKVDFSEIKALAERFKQELGQERLREVQKKIVNESLNRHLARTVKGTPTGKTRRESLNVYDQAGNLQLNKRTTVKKTYDQAGNIIEKRVVKKAGTAKKKKFVAYTGGNLKRSWFVVPAETKGSICKGSIRNSAEYASYVEYGHRQTPGRFVPAIGKRLKAGFVKGKFVMTKSENKVKIDLKEISERELKRFLGGAFDGK